MPGPTLIQQGYERYHFELQLPMHHMRGPNGNFPRGSTEDLEDANNRKLICHAQVLREAHEVDMMYDNGTDIRPLCGLTFAVKDLYDVAGYTTVAGTPALAGAPCFPLPLQGPCRDLENFQISAPCV